MPRKKSSPSKPTKTSRRRSPAKKTNARKKTSHGAAARKPAKRERPAAKRVAAVRKPRGARASVMSFGTAVVTCVTADVAVDAVTQCQIQVMGHSVPFDTKISDVLQGDAVDRFRACVARRTEVADVPCTSSMTFGQVAHGITCP